jgi:nucleotide-binding universal stress UspA family protein
MSFTFNKIMLTLDGSDIAAQAAPEAEAIAQRFGSQLVLYTVVDPPTHFQTAALVVDDRKLIEAGQERRLSEDAESARADLQAFAATLDLPPEQIDIRVGASHSAADAIVGFAAADDIDLIVICSHCRSGLGRAIYGSVGDHVLHHAPCPVLVVRAVCS